MSATISVKDWLLIFLSPILTLIPIAGHFLFLGFLIYLATKEDTAKSIQGVCKSGLADLCSADIDRLIQNILSCI